MTPPIYLDHAAGTPLHPRALEAMLPYFSERFANPSSLHTPARESAAAIDRARLVVASVLNAAPGEIVFTSGGTESVNAAIRGVALSLRRAGLGRHVITSVAEHHAVLHTCEYLETLGFEVTYLPVDDDAFVSPEDVAQAVTEETVLVTLMLVNNEVGTIEPIAEVARLLRQREAGFGRRIPLHTDAIAAAGHLGIDARALDVDALSLSSHKFGGPKGAGVLFLRRGTPFLSQLTGGGQERQRRAGTENVPGIVGTAVALEFAEAERPANTLHARTLQGRLMEGLLRVPGSRLNGPRESRVAGNTNVSFLDVEGEQFLEALDAAGIAATSGSACAASTWEPSHVLMAMAVPPRYAAGSLRLTTGPSNTPAEIEQVLEVVPCVVNRLRREAPLETLAH